VTFLDTTDKVNKKTIQCRISVARAEYLWRYESVNTNHISTLASVHAEDKLVFTFRHTAIVSIVFLRFRIGDRVYLNVIREKFEMYSVLAINQV